jgi:hypothetical protein
VVVLAACAVVVVAIVVLRLSPSPTTAALLAHFPPGDAVILSIDVQTLRRSGVVAALAGAEVSQEPEYRSFVTETGFDYERDLELALVAFQKDSVFFLLRGRFDWQKLALYVARQKGICQNRFCRVQGSTPQRNISFFPLRSDVMALAVSSDPWAAASLRSPKPDPPEITFPDNQPAWLFIPTTFLSDRENLPSGVRLFAKALEGTESIILSLAAPNDRLEARLDVACRSAEEAAALSAQLEGITRLLREWIAKEDKTPDPRDLSGVLAGGTIRREDLRVIGRWPLETAFLESLVGGPL